MLLTFWTAKSPFENDFNIYFEKKNWSVISNSPKWVEQAENNEMKDGSNWSTLGYKDQRQKNHISYSETQNENNNCFYLTRLSTHDDGNLGAVETFQRGGEFFIFYLKEIELGTNPSTNWTQKHWFHLCFPEEVNLMAKLARLGFGKLESDLGKFFSEALHLFWCLPLIKHFHFDIFVRTGQAGAGLRKPHTVGGPSPQVGNSSPSPLLSLYFFTFKCPGSTLKSQFSIAKCLDLSLNTDCLPGARSLRRVRRMSMRTNCPSSFFWSALQFLMILMLIWMIILIPNQCWRWYCCGWWCWCWYRYTAVRALVWNNGTLLCKIDFNRNLSF